MNLFDLFGTVTNMVGRGLKYFCGFLGLRGRRDKDLDLVKSIWVNLKRFLINCWNTSQPSFRILKKDSLKLAKKAFTSLHLLVATMMKKGFEIGMKSMESLWKNEQLISRVSFYVTIGLILWSIYNLFKLFFSNKDAR